jgi:hypothetical protein
LNLGDRIAMVVLGAEEIEGRFEHGNAAVVLPDQAPAHDLRMQSHHEYGDAPQRHAAGDEPRAKLTEHVFSPHGRGGALRQPIERVAQLFRLDRHRQESSLATLARTEPLGIRPPSEAR